MQRENEFRVSGAHSKTRNNFCEARFLLPYYRARVWEHPEHTFVVFTKTFLYRKGRGTLSELSFTIVRYRLRHTLTLQLFLEVKNFMSQQIIIWSVIAFVATLAVIIGALEKSIFSAHSHPTDKPNHIVEIGKEREMFYLPGDILNPDEEDDYEDFPEEF